MAPYCLKDNRLFPLQGYNLVSARYTFHQWPLQHFILCNIVFLLISKKSRQFQASVLLLILFHLPHTPSSFSFGLESLLHLRVSPQTLPLPWEQTAAPRTYGIAVTAGVTPAPRDCETIQAPPSAHLQPRCLCTGLARVSAQ